MISAASPEYMIDDVMLSFLPQRAQSELALLD